MTVRLKDIAKMAQVSEAAVSLALNGKEGVSEETRRRIIEIAQSVGYMPNAMARGLAKRKSDTLGLIVPDIENPYYGKLVKYVDKYVREAGYNLILAISNENTSIEKDVIKNFMSERVEGIIIAPTSQFSSDISHITQLDDHDIPYVFVTAYYPGTNASYVMVDLEKGSYLLVKYLLDMGHREIFFLAGHKDVIHTSARMAGYRKAFFEKGVECNGDKLITCSRNNFEQAYLATCRLLESRKAIDSIITINDIMALGALKALDEHNIPVPDRISLAGYDNMIFSSISTIPITTVHQDLEQMSWNAVHILFDEIKKGSKGGQRILIEPELIIRRSTGVKK